MTATTKTRGKYRVDPIDVSKDVWLYEGPDGVSVMRREISRDGHHVCTTEAKVPWSALCDLVDRHRKINT